MVYGKYIYTIPSVYKPTYNWGAPHCRKPLYMDLSRNIVVGFTRNHLSLTGEQDDQRFWGSVPLCSCLLRAIQLGPPKALQHPIPGLVNKQNYGKLPFFKR